MKPKTTQRKVSPASLSLTPIIRKSLAFYLLSVVIVSAVCFFLGWRSLENIGTGLVYGSLGLALFGTLTFAGNTVPAQLSKLSLPKYKAPSVKRHQEVESDDSPARDEVIKFLFITLLCAALLFITGAFLKIVW